MPAPIEFSTFESLYNKIFKELEPSKTPSKTPSKKTHMYMHIYIESEYDEINDDTDKMEDSVMIGMPSPKIIPREKTFRVRVIESNNQPCNIKKIECVENERITILKNGCKIDLPFVYITTGKIKIKIKKNETWWIYAPPRRPSRSRSRSRSRSQRRIQSRGGGRKHTRKPTRKHTRKHTRKPTRKHTKKRK